MKNKGLNFIDIFVIILINELAVWGFMHQTMPFSPGW